jgi:hypothetical protein
MLLSSVLNKNAHSGCSISGTPFVPAWNFTAAMPENSELFGKPQRAGSADVGIVALLALSPCRRCSTSHAPKAAPPMRFDLSIADALGGPALSPDGRTIAYVARPADGKRMLWIRPIGADAGQQVPGTEEASAILWSPDSRRIAFVAEGKLKKIALAGGNPNLIAEVGSLRGADWNRSGVILLARTSSNVIETNNDSGGPITPAAKIDTSRQEYFRPYPYFFPMEIISLYVSVEVNRRIPEFSSRHWMPMQNQPVSSHSSRTGSTEWHTYRQAF